MTTDSDMQFKRAIVGLLSLASGTAAVGLLFVPGYDALQGSLVRVGLVLGALWLALPTDQRPAAWAYISPWSVAIIIAAAVLVRQLKIFFPILIAGIAIGWFVRPRNKK